jgi:hypothetical protein
LLERVEMGVEMGVELAPHTFTLQPVTAPGRRK